MKEVKFANQLVDFIYDSPSPFHVVSNVSKKLEKQGFIKLNLRDKWNIEKGGKYYVTKNNSALIAFVIGASSKLALVMVINRFCTICLLSTFVSIPCALAAIVANDKP